jgi:hypothetical protein
LSAPLPFDLGEIIHEELARSSRPNDYLLHASSHINGPLRHTQLEVAGAPKKQRDVMSEITLMTGTLWHEFVHNMLRRLGLPYMAEVNLNPWLPEGWGGTADAVIWNPDLKAFVLVDFKTIKGEGMSWIQRGGAKDDHKLQTSAYWHALKKMGLPMAKVIAIWYLPKNDVRGGGVEPLLVDFEPYPEKALHAQMEERREAVQRYRDSLPLGLVEGALTGDLDLWLTPELAPIQAPEQRAYYDKTTGTWDVKLVRSWTADYCPYDVELCPCSLEPKTTKIGLWDTDGTYYPRTGFEHIEVTAHPPAG